MNKIRRILALAGVILLLLLYGATLYLALTDSADTMAVFKASIVTTILVPVLLWAYSFVYRMVREQRPEFDGTDEEEKENQK